MRGLSLDLCRAGLCADIQSAELPVTIDAGNIVSHHDCQLSGGLLAKKLPCRSRFRFIARAFAHADRLHQIRFSRLTAACDHAHITQKCIRVHLIGILADTGPCHIAVICL